MRRLTTLPPSYAVVTKSGNLNFLEHSLPLQVCNGTDLPLPIYGPGSLVGIATDYGLDGPGSNPGADEIFPPVQAGPGSVL